MCGCHSIYEPIDPERAKLTATGNNGYDRWAINRYNVAPTTRVEIIGPDGGLSIDKVRWEWSPFWAKGKRHAPINARVETVTTGKFLK